MNRVEPAGLRAALAILGPLARTNVPLGPLTTYRVGGPAALYVEAATLDVLLVVSEAVRASDLPVLVVGRGSNLLVADAGFAGVAVSLVGERFAAIDLPADGNVPPAARATVRAGAAVHLPVLARQTAAAGLTGLEWAVGVPGSVGGAVRMNAGGHGADINASLTACRWVDLTTGDVVERTGPELAFGYRRSAVSGHDVVIDAEFGLRAGDRRSSQATIRDIVRWRREHQPGGQNAGSVFTNPPGDPPGNSAGWVVEAAGLKGRRHGSAMVSDKHANFIQADPGGSADDVVALMIEVQRGVQERFGLRLVAEVRLVGFDQASISTLGLW
jgi:UDP-N-acetylmuramate dehydrogenase